LFKVFLKTSSRPSSLIFFKTSTNPFLLSKNNIKAIPAKTRYLWSSDKLKSPDLMNWSKGITNPPTAVPHVNNIFTLRP
jgi:hypothetical protein